VTRQPPVLPKVAIIRPRKCALLAKEFADGSSGYSTVTQGILTNYGGWEFAASNRWQESAHKPPRDLTVEMIYFPLFFADQDILHETPYDTIENGVEEPIVRALRLMKIKLELPERLFIPKEWAVSCTIISTSIYL
jgi:hypothetical protein